MSDKLVKYFRADINGIELPRKFTFPFYYEPHPLCIIAANELQEDIQNQTEWEHNFGLIPNQNGMVIGKMFGVMVVKDKSNNIGYLSAFSGKLAEKNHLSGFVPPLFDMLDENSFFKKEEKVLNNLNEEIKLLENDSFLIELIEKKRKLTLSFEEELTNRKKELKDQKTKRGLLRNEGMQSLSDNDYQKLIERLKNESIQQQLEVKKFKKMKEEEIRFISSQIQEKKEVINHLKLIRKDRSADLQKKLFDQYHFLNAHQETKSLLDIFENTSQKIPPAGAGECAAPKLLQYAYKNNLQPIAMAEFWWGASPKSEVRKHQEFYPSCNGKCKPILSHMLEGIKVDDNPMLESPSASTQMDIIYDDEYLTVISKPEEFLSVPGINVTDSVYTRYLDMFPDASGPIIVHRLDMSTSGLLVLAKDKNTHKSLQRQFINKTVQKRYIALLDGIIDSNEGIIELPLRVDLDDRPRQLVCYDHGKPAKTKYKVIQVSNNKTLIHFFPITGRTHQLRVHAAHKEGLHCPIVGDDIYGKKHERLHLHAEYLSFIHPFTRQKVEFYVKANFG